MTNVANDIDEKTEAHVIIDEVHSMGHEGFVYHASGKVAGLVNAGTAEFLLVTGAVEGHFQRMGLTFGRGDIDIHSYEGATASNDGTPITSYCTNRVLANTPTMVMSGSPTVTDDGTLIHTLWATPTTTGTGQSSGGVQRVTQGEEWIMKPNTKYLVRITNNSGVTISYAYDILWYEVGY